MRHASRMRSVQAPIISILGRLIDETPGTISLGQGIVAYGPPAEALSALGSFGRRPDDHQYGPVEGIPALVEAFERKLAAENGLTVRPSSRVVVTAGANMAFMNAVLAVTDPGDEIILQVPYYFNHEMAVAMVDCTCVVVPTDSRYQLRPDLVRAAIGPRTRAVVTVSPNNPTGAVYGEPVLREVNGICRDRGVYHIHDEAYEYFTYGNASHFSPGSIASAGDHTISLFSLSKGYGLASWRIGCMVIPADLFEDVVKIQDTILVCPAAASQHAALAALGVGAAYPRGHLPALARTRARVLEELDRIADICDVARPDGAFYCMLRIRAALDAGVVAERLIREHRVAVVPGGAFGLHDGCYLRLSYGALEPETVADGVGRLVSGLRSMAANGPGPARRADQGRGGRRS